MSTPTTTAPRGAATLTPERLRECELDAQRSWEYGAPEERRLAGNVLFLIAALRAATEGTADAK